MNTQRWERISSLLERAVELMPAARREFYARECVDDPTIGDEVERLVGADSEALRFLEPTAGPAAPTIPAAPLAPGARIGGYTLIRRIGVGGMGVVFEASQEHPQRRVALKLIQSVFASSATLLRFRYEAEALGRLRHAGIAQVYEAGVDADSQGVDRPFLAMEYVEDARPITEYVRENALDFERIVRLSIAVCAAVQHGHERGVLHRDIKASNVLVDSSGAPKLIDFGIAKVLGDTHTRATEAGEIVGTLASMSPEQLEGSLDVLDVRSDVYALGALLYEMLCGRPMLDLKGLSITEALIRARSANHPSPSSVRPDLPIELEWIVLRALESERERRYASASDLGHDLERYIGDEPVHASPPSTVYRARKFVRRNRLVVSAVTAVLAAVVGGAILALVQRDRAVIAKERAEAAEGLAEFRLARLEVEVNTNRELAEFQGSILKNAGPDLGGRDVRVVDALKSASLDLDQRTNLEPRLWLALRRSIVDAYISLGLPSDADREIDRMQPVWESAYPRDDVERIALERLQLETEGNFVPAAELLPRVEAGLARAEAATTTDSCELARWQLLAVLTVKALGRFDEADALVRAAHATLEAKFGPTSSIVIETQLVLAGIQAQMRKVDEAGAIYQRTYELCLEEFGEDHRLTLLAKEALAFSLGSRARIGEAIEMYHEIVESHARRSGPQSVTALSSRSELAEFLFQAQRPAEALEVLESMIADTQAALGERNGLIHSARARRAMILLVLDRIDEALAGFEEALRGSESNLGADESQTIDIRSQFAFHLFRLGRLEQALPHCKEAWLASCRVLGEESGHTLLRGNGYGVLLANTGRKREAITVLEWLLGVQEKKYGPTHEDCILTLKNLTSIQSDVGDFASAICSGHLLVDRAESANSSDFNLCAGAHWALGHALKGLPDLDSAALHMGIGSHLWSRSSEAGRELAIFGLIDEALVLEKLGRSAESLDVLEHAVALSLAPGLSPSMRSRAITEFAEALLRSGESERARELAEMVVSGSGEMEPEIRSRAERILDPG